MNRTLKMRSLILSTAVMLVFSGLGIADDMSNMPGMSHDQKAADTTSLKTVTITGEVVDTGCYIENGEKGEDHAACAKMCIQSGVPAAIATSSGKLYIILGENHKAPADVVKGFEGKQVKVTGKIAVKGGCSFITVSKIAEAKTKTVSTTKN